MITREIREMGERVLYDHIIKYKVEMELVTPLHVGASFSDRNEVLVHPVDGLPFVQASSITGSLRDYYERNMGAEKAAELFGSTDISGGSRINVSDGSFKKDTVRFEMRPRVKIDPVSGTAGKTKAKGTNVTSGHKFDMECVAKGSKFSFSCYVRGKDFSDADEMIGILSALNEGGITFGGQKSNGFGDVKITKLLCRKFDLTDSGDRRSWINEENLREEDYENAMSGLSKTQGYAYRITVDAKTESGILVKGYKKEAFGNEGPDAINIQDANGDYFVPGSSIKGTVRNQIERILLYKVSDEGKRKGVITNIFGETESDGKAGNMIAYDARINIPGNAKLTTTNRIHIDKVKGGVMNTGLFSEQRAFGDICIKIDITKRNNPELSCGYLLMALRDLALNLYNLGSGYSIGNGMVEVKSISVSYPGGKAVIDMKSGNVEDNDGIIDKCIRKTGEE